MPRKTALRLSDGLSQAGSSKVRRHALDCGQTEHSPAAGAKADPASRSPSSRCRPVETGDWRFPSSPSGHLAPKKNSPPIPSVSRTRRRFDIESDHHAGGMRIAGSRILDVALPILSRVALSRKRSPDCPRIAQLARIGRLFRIVPERHAPVSRCRFPKPRPMTGFRRSIGVRKT